MTLAEKLKPYEGRFVRLISPHLHNTISKELIHKVYKNGRVALHYWGERSVAALPKHRSSLLADGHWDELGGDQYAVTPTSFEWSPDVERRILRLIKTGAIRAAWVESPQQLDEIEGATR